MQVFLDSVCEALQESYGLQAPTLLSGVERGYSSQNFVIQDKDKKYFLKLYPTRRPLSLVLEIHTVEKFFSEHGVPVVNAMQNTKGSTVSEHAGRLYSLFQYVDGRELHSLPSEKAAASTGSVLARLHLASKDGVPFQVSRIQERWHKQNFLTDAYKLRNTIDTLESPSEFDVQAKELLALRIRIAEETPLRFEELGFEDNTLLHGDYHYHNMFFNDQDDLTHLFDFERSRMGARATEVGYAVFFNCLDIINPALDDITERNFEVAKAYLDSYRATYPMADDDVRKGILWYYYMHSHRLWPLDSHYVENNLRADKLVASRLKRLKYFYSNLEKILALAVAK